MESEKRNFRVTGNEMAGDRMQKGDIVIVEVRTETSPGDIVLLELTSKKTPVLRRLEYQGNNCMLIPSNESVEVEYHATENVKVIGKVVQTYILY